MERLRINKPFKRQKISNNSFYKAGSLKSGLQANVVLLFPPLRDDSR